MYGAKKFLGVFFFVQLGACAGEMLRSALHYEKYLTSAPLWVHFLPTLALTAVSLTLTAIAYALVCRAIRKKEGKEET